jgi:hypothetical protein
VAMVVLETVVVVVSVLVDCWREVLVLNLVEPARMLVRVLARGTKTAADEKQVAGDEKDAVRANKAAGARRRRAMVTIVCLEEATLLLLVLNLWSIVRAGVPSS